MVLPQLFSDKGRHVLLMYAFMLTFSGPSKTTLQNTGILSESLTCLQVRSREIYIIISYTCSNRDINHERACSDVRFQDEIESSIRQIVEIIKKPLLAVRSSVMRIKAELATIIDKMKKSTIAVKNTVTALGEQIAIKYFFVFYEYYTILMSTETHTIPRRAI